MGITQVHVQDLALLLNTVADAVYFQLLLEAFGYADDHVVDECAGQTVQCTILLLIVRTGYGDGVAFNSNLHSRMNVTGQGAVLALDGDGISVELDLDAFRYCDRHSTNSRHVQYLLTIRTPGLRRRRSAREPSCRS